MTNKIDSIDNNRTAPVGSGRGVERVRDAAAGRNPAADSPSDVDITGTARQLAALEQDLANQSPIDEGRVETVRSAIEQGRYTISPERIADQLIKLERALGHLKG